MGVKGVVGSLTAVLAVLAGVFYQQSPVLRVFLDRTTHELTDNSACTHIPEAQACEKIVVHQDSGLLYLACSTPAARLRWAPYFQVFTEASPTTDHVAVYDHNSGALKRLTLENFSDPRGLHVHGMDVVTSRTDPSVLWVYVINHRPQLKAGMESEIGADEAIEVFKTTPGGNSLVHVRTFDDQSVLITPNDVTGSADGESFYFVNDHPSRLGKWDRLGTLWLATASTNVGYCHVDTGCKIAAKDIIGANGIVRTNDDTIWVAGATDGYIRSFTRQADNTLVLTEAVKVGHLVDNLTTDGKGNIYAANLVVKPAKVMPYFKDPFNRISPSAAYNISLNTGRDAYFGEKYSVKNIFEDDGSVMSGITTVAYDHKAKLLYLSGLVSLSTVVCPA